MRRTYLITLENCEEDDWEWVDLLCHLEGTDHTEFNVISHQELILPTDADRGEDQHWSQAQLSPYFS